MIVVGAGEVFWYGAWTFLLMIFLDCGLTYLATHWTFLNNQGRYIHILILTCDEEMRLPLSNDGICKEGHVINILYKFQYLHIIKSTTAMQI